jgi:hypothetical protein
MFKPVKSQLEPLAYLSADRDFTLVSEVSEVLGSLVSFHIVEKAAYIFGSNWVWIIRSTEGWRANVRDSNCHLD